MTQSGHILVAEDDSTDAYFFQRAFNRAGIPVTLHFVRDGQEVLDYLQGEGQFADRAAHPLPQLLLLDLKMPRLDGFEVLEWLKGHPEHGEIPIVVLSGFVDMVEQVTRAYNRGAHSFLTKPVQLRDIQSILSLLKISI